MIDNEKRGEGDFKGVFGPEAGDEQTSNKHGDNEDAEDATFNDHVHERVDDADGFDLMLFVSADVVFEFHLTETDATTSGVAKNERSDSEGNGNTIIGGEIVMRSDGSEPKENGTAGKHGNVDTDEHYDGGKSDNAAFVASRIDEEVGDGDNSNADGTDGDAAERAGTVQAENNRKDGEEKIVGALIFLRDKNMRGDDEHDTAVKAEFARFSIEKFKAL